MKNKNSKESAVKLKIIKSKNSS